MGTQAILANYNDYVEDVESLRVRPIISGFVLYSVRRKRFLAHVASNPGGYLGKRPALPPQLQQAIQNSQFSATLLVEPGLTTSKWAGPICSAGASSMGRSRPRFPAASSSG